MYLHRQGPYFIFTIYSFFTLYTLKTQILATSLNAVDIFINKKTKQKDKRDNNYPFCDSRLSYALECYLQSRIFIKCNIVLS